MEENTTISKVDMSLDEIIKMEKKRKSSLKAKHAAMRGGARGNIRGNRNTMRGGPMRNTMRSTVRGGIRNMRGNIRGRSSSLNRRGQWKKFPQNNMRGGFMKRFNNGNMKSNLARSRSNLSLNRMNMNSPRGMRGGFGPRRGGRYGLPRSRSRTNLSYSRSPYMPKNMGFLKRTASMPDLRDPTSVYNRLGYQSPAQMAYRNRVKRAKNLLIQRQSKAMRMQNAFALSPSKSPLDRTQIPGRRYSAGNLRSEQIMRAQRQAQYEQKLMRMGASRSNIPMTMSFLNAYNANQHPAMSLYQSSQNQGPLMMASRRLQRGRSPFKKSLQSLKAVPKTEPNFQQTGRATGRATSRAASRAASRARSRAASRAASASRLQQRRSRSRSRSRPRNPRTNSIINLSEVTDLEDRSFSEVMYSLSNNFGVTGRTLNDRFTLF